MKPNGYQVFESRQGELTACEAIAPSLEEAEAKVKIPRDYMGELTFVILPIYTNRLPEKD